jgi:uncharacterized protein YuzE
MASVEFDPEINAMYIRIKKGKIEKSEPLADNITVDVDVNGNWYRDFTSKAGC